MNWPKTHDSDYIIAGPCSAESRKQVLEVSNSLKAIGKVKALRFGVWKPRTRPGAFEGIGSQALSWIQEAKESTGLPVMVEVANVQHVKACLDAKVDMVWLGARTTVNPFYVQEIADALKGNDIPVWIKNPMHPDIGLWQGAIERFHKVGIEKVGAIHRGFYSYDSRPFRNEPKWEIALDLRQKFPEIPILVDPSHIAGKGSLIQEVCQTALDLRMNGLMVEVHPEPKSALSDAQQQITPDHFLKMLDLLVWRMPSTSDESFLKILEKKREAIDSIDSNLVEILAKRFALVEEIGAYKKEHGVTILQLERWFKIMEMRKSQGKSLGLSEELIHELYQIIHKNSIRIQTQVMRKADEK